MQKIEVCGEDIVDAARSYVDVPFKHMGRTRHGLDCVGLVAIAGCDVGLKDISDIHIPTYGRVPRPTLFDMALRCELVKCEYGQVRPGDVLLFSIRKLPQHLAIYAEREGVPYMIHAYSRFKKVVEHRIDRDWEQRLIAVWKWPELEETYEWQRSH